MLEKINNEIAKKSRVTPIDLKNNSRNLYVINGGLIGIDNSSLDKYLKKSNFLRLHAILHNGPIFKHKF